MFIVAKQLDGFKMPLGMEVCLGLRDIVFSVDPATPRKRAHPPHPIFGPCLLWPDGWMDEDAAWYGSRPRRGSHCTRWSPSSLKRGACPLFGPCLMWTRSPISATAELLFTYIFAVLLPDVSRLSCHSVQRMFLKMNTRHQAHKLVKKCNYWGPIFQKEWSRGSNCVSVPNFEAIAPTEIWRYFAILDFKFLKFLTVGRLKRAELCRHAEFGRNRPKRGRDMAIF